MTYSSSIAASRRGLRVRRNQNSVAFIKKGKTLGPISNTVVLIVLGCLIGLLYLTQVTKTNSFGYEINNLKEEQLQLKSQKTDLEIKSARLQSFDRIASSPKAKDLVSVAPSGSIQ
ncbi:MAG TPA: hypothetical protein VI336_01675 [Candidatus Saccharimonadales bacterium]|nr:hypothetical protein [Candidatus Saccharimonadales bacterium]